MQTRTSELRQSVEDRGSAVRADEWQIDEPGLPRTFLNAPRQIVIAGIDQRPSSKCFTRRSRSVPNAFPRVLNAA